MIAERIKEAREKMGYSQTNFADRIGETKQTVYKYENGIVTNIPSNKIEKMADVLNVSPSYLMGWEEPEQGAPPTAYPLTYTEKALVDAFRSGDRSRRDLMLLAAGLTEKNIDVGELAG